MFQAGDKDHSRETLSTCSCRLSPLATVEDTCNAEEIESSHLQYIYISLITITVSKGIRGSQFKWKLNTRPHHKPQTGTEKLPIGENQKGKRKKPLKEDSTFQGVLYTL